jgi:hypothetical protein
VAVTAAGVGIGVWDHSVILAVVLGAGAWAGRMVAAVFARRRRDRQARPRPAQLDPWSVPEPWKQLVQQAATVQSRFDQAVTDWADGPIKDRLTSLQPQLYAGMEQVGVAAKRGAMLSGWSGGMAAPGRPSAEALAEQLHRAESERQRLSDRSSERRAALARTEEAIAAQLRAARSAEDAAGLVHDRLRVLVASLDQTVTSVLVLGVGGNEAGADAVAASISNLADEVAALHRGLTDATSQVGGNPALPPSLPPTP